MTPPQNELLDPPTPDRETGLRALRLLLREGDILPVLVAMHQGLGDVFRLPLPGFNPVVMVGPQANHFIHVTARQHLKWRMEGDPITRLLRHGLLVEDGSDHDSLRRLLAPALRRQRMPDYSASIVRATDRVMDTWQDGSTKDMLVEMRRVALLILMETLFGDDFLAEMPRLWKPILRLLKYISPGLWLIWPKAPQPGYGRAKREIDAYLYGLIRERRRAPTDRRDMLSMMLAEPGLDDDLIRDQMMTMLIAGHDTCTALLAWALYLLGKDAEAMRRVRDEIDRLPGDKPPKDPNIASLAYLDGVVKEALRLYPPVHLGMRVASRDLTFRQYRIPAGTRLIYSIYLTHRQVQHWPDPDRFLPGRFSKASDHSRPSYAYLPFGGGPRNCIGASYGLHETKVVLTRLFQMVDLVLMTEEVRPHLGATLEPHPGVFMRVTRRARVR